MRCCRKERGQWGWHKSGGQAGRVAKAVRTEQNMQSTSQQPGLPCRLALHVADTLRRDEAPCALQPPCSPWINIDAMLAATCVGSGEQTDTV